MHNFFGRAEHDEVKKTRKMWEMNGLLQIIV